MVWRSLATATDDEENLEWIPIDDFSNHDIRPAFLKKELREVINGAPLVHIISDDRGKKC